MRVNFVNNKFVVDPEMDFAELNNLLPFVAYVATHDLRSEYQDLKYTIVDGAIYGWRSSTGVSRNEWWYYDPSVRRWSQCDDPNEK